jgi:signal peptidase I
LITIYEGNELKIDGEKILINGKQVDSYTPRMNYYWMMGDNRHNSLDSRFWGFVPEDHVVGKAVFIWLSLDSNAESFFSRVRWNRLFTVINDNGISRSFFLPVLVVGLLIFFILKYRRKKKTKA